MNSAALLSKNAKTTLGELHVLLPRGLKGALKSVVGFLNTYFELLQFIEIIYITNKCNQCHLSFPTCLSFVPFVRLLMRNIQTAVSAQPLEIGHMLTRNYLLGIVHTTNLLIYLLFLLNHPVYSYQYLLVSRITRFLGKN